ncbi:protein of unknown function [Pseudorhizobium banfieldiae]|uniref:Uncharacterized protein n=1 Tax=Pseudorhizobium banfieldiae TaxID=1125847 RepID=L0NGY7_9HYPH|nr:protein of unknown function [Pseudorhizobium banfieldiae]
MIPLATLCCRESVLSSCALRSIKAFILRSRTLEIGGTALSSLGEVLSRIGAACIGEASRGVFDAPERRSTESVPPMASHRLKMSLMTKMSLKKELLHLPLVLLAKSPICSSEESADVNNSRDRWMWFYRAPRRRRTSGCRLPGPRP